MDSFPREWVRVGRLGTRLLYDCGRLEITCAFAISLQLLHQKFRHVIVISLQAIFSISSDCSDRVMAREMALLLVLVAAALLRTAITETIAPDAQDNHSNNGELNYTCRVHFILLKF